MVALVAKANTNIRNFSEKSCSTPVCNRSQYCMYVCISLVCTAALQLQQFLFSGQFCHYLHGVLGDMQKAMQWLTAVLPAHDGSDSCSAVVHGLSDVASSISSDADLRYLTTLCSTYF